MGRDDCGMLGAEGACEATGRDTPVRRLGGIFDRRIAAGDASR